MLIRTPRKSDVLSSEITPHSVFLRRREFLRAASATSATAALGPFMLSDPAFAGAKLPNVKKTKWTAESLGENDKPTPYEDVTSYNNFYEFGTGKGDPKRKAGSLKTKPWTVVVDGHCENPGRYDFDDLIKVHALEERVYRFRCVEAWSMVIPWVGVPLADIIKRMGPTADAKYVSFETLVDPEQMPGQKFAILKWPYREGLRMDEAMNPLTLMAVGLYGEEMPNQNGAPIRLVTPWKYGFKSIKSIVRISFTDKQPPTSWNLSAPREYGFYSNVNPLVNHPRWSQAKERRLGGPTNVFGFVQKRPTLMFNGYEEEVAAMYKDMDLARYY
ncbi:MAG: protein-methionine-sulfoxide reductase catalytic subunit MsrP [Magnetovibrio sp.]|nr:protein-methionine-sulfoxide reductase catalytic subunit MsrP [Magnetovibrio sp.]